MKARWLELAGKYAALSQRERAMVAVAAIALVVYVGNTLWLGPIYGRAEGFARQTAQQEKEFAKLQQQLLQLQTEAMVDPNAAVRASLAEVQAQLKSTDEQLASFEQTLVPPQKMLTVLNSLLRDRRNVQVLSLKNMPVQPLTADIAPQPATASEGSKELPPPPAVLIYRHGFELKLEGNYLDLTACLAELEAGTQQLLWQRAVLKAGEERKSTLTLTFFTLSLNKAWLSL